MLKMYRYCMGDSNVVLIAVSETDIASTNQADALMRLAEWISLPDVEGSAAFSRLHCRIWILPGSILREDFLARRWFEATGESPSEVIFPSRHSAASGRPSLTLHPIGVMQLDTDEEPPYGGKAGDAPPPSPRLASWWKELLHVASTTDFGLEFDTSLEVTHHGPWLEVPSLFIEVGSTDATWGHVPAAECLAGIIHRETSAVMVRPCMNSCAELAVELEKPKRRTIMVQKGGKSKLLYFCLQYEYSQLTRRLREHLQK